MPLPPQVPPGCEDAFAAINAYHRSAGSTKSSQAAAAFQAQQSLSRVSLDNYGGAVYSITVALSQDFQRMWHILNGFVHGDYAAAVAATNSDIDTLRTVCAPS